MLEDTFKKELLARAAALEKDAEVLREQAWQDEESAREKAALADKMETRARESRLAAGAIQDYPPDDDDGIPF